MHQIGVLMLFESLLSCYGEEVTMLEDFAVAVNDLRNVTFKLEETTNPFDLRPIIAGGRGKAEYGSSCSEYESWTTLLVITTQPYFTKG